MGMVGRFILLFARHVIGRQSNDGSQRVSMMWQALYDARPWGTERHIEDTVFRRGDVVLEENMFPYETPPGRD